ncbi:MAG: prephenate dehydratase [Armatimonadota bacterium]|nr:prephenate dehydratase [bacterium]MDW8321072.1 prephenate dehydratase [Armatimonadota bacterium]
MTIHDLRKEIDQIDEQILQLLNRRAELAQQIGKVKARSRTQFFTPEREQQIYRRLTQLNKGPLSNQQLRAVFREIISAARALEKPLVIAYWGPPGTFSHQAGVLKFGTSSEFVPVDSIQEVFHEVERSSADYGIVPVENSTAGVIPETLDQFMHTNLKICSELYVPIAYYLVSLTTLENVKRVYTGAQPREQCKGWLRQHLPGTEIVEVSTTARAAEMAKEDTVSAAVTNALAAQMYDVPIICEHIEDNPHNRTRFLVIGYNEPEPTGKDKTSLMFSVQHRPGALFRAMAAFEMYNVNMTMIESRPTKLVPGEYIFYVDVQGHIKDAPVAKALAALRERSLFVTVLGSYPEAE